MVKHVLTSEQFWFVVLACFVSNSFVIFNSNDN